MKKINKYTFTIQEYILFLFKFGHTYLKKNKKTTPNIEESLDIVLNHLKDENYKGFIRFGDGEYYLMKGRSISFQPKSKFLSSLLYDALKNKNKLNIDIGVDIPNLLDKKGISNELKLPWPYFYTKNYNTTQSYIYTGFTMPYLHFVLRKEGNNIDSYLHKFQGMFANKKIALFIGQGILNKIDFLPFDNAQSLEIIKCPSENAFAEYENLYNKAKGFSQDTLLCFVIGPASKVLSYKLMSDGYTCFDLGHFIKDYDMRKKNILNADNFFDKDI